MNDPRNYDVRELRTLAGTHPDEAPAAGVEQAPDRESSTSPARNQSEARAYTAQFVELVLGSRGRSTASGRPYLQTVPTGVSAERLVGDWLSYLVEIGGQEGASEALSYYERIGWIAPEARSALERRLPGLRSPRHRRPYEPADHRISLCCLRRIAAVEATRTEDRGTAPGRGAATAESLADSKEDHATRPTDGPKDDYDHE
ncbi:Archaellum protein D/E [Halalkaliarchaeum sp. AArc-CO]|uniref:FlaD/FlaE family flagellar protein n=1 Tax=unclassified Halalkaliarchaeum TaxID=2678344 RepID=UPI00217D65CC|nr:MULTISPECIES: FlaD/FlaE family flagellar protein [unclassified Halalkaliarchaeum]MDR5672403.1 FlaD/FlaE family flagellar protein [Halalkaliarchaeum sp. AArc-GB]UWG49965.1 Archaellum protein D/E [Halalkaliarchaeum sp. AArc-CO]